VYTPEFRAEAVKLVEVEKLTVGQSAKRLAVPNATLGTE
jgi:transposase-like protein